MCDIICIFDSNGNQIAKYYYDAWGNCEIVVDNTPQSAYNTNIAQINPFRYRGYYYDVETGFYYLNSRYYDPALGRFINADDISYANASLLNGLNLYAYCGNNPVANVDENGSAWWDWLFGALIAAAAIAVSIVTFGAGATFIAMGIGAIVGAASYAIPTALTGSEWNWTDFWGSTIGSGLAAPFALLGGSKGLYMSAFLSGLFTEFYSELFKTSIEGRGINIAQTIFNGVLNGAITALFAGLTKNVFKITGINSGRNSLSAISSQIYTKLSNQTIKHITTKTFMKMVGASFYESIMDILYTFVRKLQN